MLKINRLRIVSILLMLVLSMTMFAGLASAREEVIEIDILQFKVEIAPALEAAARKFEEAHPGVRIIVRTVGGGDDYHSALRAVFAAGVAPTIFNVGGPQDVADWAHTLKDLTEEPWVKLAYEGVLDGVTVDGRVFGLPFNIEGYGFIYNRRIFEAAGIDSAEIVDFESLEAAAKKLHAKIQAGELREEFPRLEAVFELAAAETWVTGKHTANAVLAQEFASSIEAFYAEEVEFRYGDALRALIHLQARFSPHADAWWRLNAVDYMTQVDMGIAIERVAIIQQGNWVFGGVNAINPDVAASLGILPFPVKGAVEDSIPVGVPFHWAINKYATEAEIEAAKAFLNWLYTSDEGMRIVVEEFFFIPPLRVFAEAGFKPADPLALAILDFAAAGRTMPWVFMGAPSGWAMDVLGVEIQRYLAGEATWEEVISVSKESWADLRR